MRNLRLAVGVPSTTMVHMDFTISLLGLMMDVVAKPIEGYRSVEARLVNVKGSILSRSRHQIVQMAKEYRATHLLFVDSDMKFQPNIARALLRHNKPVVAANCATKSIPASPTARAKGEGLAGSPVFTTPKSSELERVWRVGTGVMLVDMNIFSHLQQPYFGITWVPELEDYRGEDWSFCEELEKAKIPIYVDHQVSAGIGHIGEFVYAHDVVQ